MSELRSTGTVLRAVALTGAVAALTFSPFVTRAAEDAKKHEGQIGKGSTPTSMAQLMHMDPEECMKMMDKEHKGHVTKADFMKFQEQLWQKMDKNRDGKADRAEFTDAG